MDLQIALMKVRFPQFEVRFNGGWHVIWEGALRPFAKTYRLQISYMTKARLGELQLRPWFPQVWLMQPRLEKRVIEPDEPIPHIYPPAVGDFTRSSLCLFDPKTEEWTPDMAIADTTVPWAIDWLASYEGWQATGEWKGGGRAH